MSIRFQDSTYTFPHGTIYAIGQFKYPCFRKGLRIFSQTYRGSTYSQLFIKNYLTGLWLPSLVFK